MSKIIESSLHPVYLQIREILSKARSQAWQAVNSAMVTAYWNIGRVIVEEEQKGKERARYGAGLIESLSRKLTAEFGNGYSPRNLWFMRDFFLAYPKVNALRTELSWAHYRFLLKVEKPAARAFYEAEAVNARWSTRELERQINSLLFERLALSRDKKGNCNTFFWSWERGSLSWADSNGSLWMGITFMSIPFSTTASRRVLS